MAHPSHFIKFTCAAIPAPKNEFEALMGTDVPRITGGYGGWEVVDHPRRRGSIEWVGVEPMEMQLELVFDAWAKSDRERTDIDEQLSILEMMAKPYSKTEKPDPTATSPEVHVSGKAMPRVKAMPWVITNLTWGSTIYNTEGDMLRATVGVTLLQADQAEYKRPGANPTEARNIRPPGHVRGGVYRWKKGDTWAKIAQRFMGSKKHATELMRFNKKRKGDKIKVGFVVRFPRIHS